MPEVLASTSLFEGVDAAATERLSACFERQIVDGGKAVYTQGALGSTLFVVLSGAVKLSRTQTDGRRRVLSLKGRGDIFGELALFDPGPRTVTATTVATTVLAAVTDVHLRLWIAERPEVGVQLLRALARLLRSTETEASDLIRRDATSRVGNLLLSLSERLGVPQSGGVRVEHGLNQTELADLAGTSREVVNKALGEFAQQGWVRAEGSSFTVVDAGGLERRSRQTDGRPGGRPLGPPTVGSRMTEVSAQS